MYADSACKSSAHDEVLKQKGIGNYIHERACRNKPLTKEQKQNNGSKSKIRNTVERVFGVMKLHYSFGKARYLGVQRNLARSHLIAISHSVERAINIQKNMEQYAF